MYSTEHTFPSLRDVCALKDNAYSSCEELTVLAALVGIFISIVQNLAVC